MKKALLFITTILAISVYGQQPTFEWAKQFSGTSGGSRGNSITTDASGNVYTTGRFSGTVDFDPGLGTFNLTSSGGFDVFISKLDASGNFVWAKQIGDADWDIGFSLDSDASGNIYITGRFEGTVDFDPGPGTFNLTSLGNMSGDTDIFILKLDASGNFDWAVRMGGIGREMGLSLKIDNADNVYTTGYFEETVDFDPGAGVFNLTATGSSDLFLSKLDASGNFVWAKQIAVATGNNFNVTTDASDNVYISGAFEGIVDFNPGTGVFNLTAIGNKDIFITKLDALGNFVWAKQMGGTESNYCYSIATDASNNVYTTGTFYGTTDFDPGASTFNFTDSGSGDIFISKLDASGNFVWAKQLGGALYSDEGESINIDAFGNVYVTGTFRETVDFDPGSGTLNLTSDGLRDFFVLKLDASGNFVWAKQMGGTNSDVGNSITSDVSGNVYTTGYFSGTVDFDPSTSTFNLTSAGGDGAFVHKMSQCIEPIQPSSINGSTLICNGNTETYSVTNDPNADTYNWTLPSGWSGTSTTNSISVTAGSTGGTIEVTAENTCGTSTQETLTVNVNDVPDQPSTITGNNDLCAGDVETYSVTNDPNADTYNWTMPSGWSGTSTTNNINVTAGSTGGTIEVTAENACGTSTVETLTVNVNDIPAQPSSISGNTDLCNGDAETFSVTNDPNADTYNWTLSGGLSGTSTSNSINVTAGSTGGTIEVTATNACGTSTVQTIAVNVNDVPAQPSTITGNTNLCAGDVETYSVTNDPDADTYNWTLPSGWSGTSTSNSINGTSGSTGGTIEVTAENACGASSPQTIAITVDDVPAQPGTISGDDVVCEGSEQNYGITSVSGATDYTWSLPGGWSGTSTTNMITTTVSTLGGNLTVTANNACGSSTPQTLSITVNELPTVTYDQDPAFACVYHDAFTLGSVSPSGGTFSGTGVSGNDFDPGTADIGTHDITYTYTDGNGCSNEAMQQIEVDGCVGLEDQENQSMTVYPNPFDEAFTIEFNKSGDHTVELLNSLGQIITTVRTEEQSTQISSTDLSPGVYYIRVVEDNSSFKVIKK